MSKFSLDNPCGYPNPEYMDFTYVMDHIIRDLDHAKIQYALIGGFAIALRGVQRATVDLDFILMLEDLEKADAVFTKTGYKRAFRSENVSHYIADNPQLGRIDILHAFRGPSLSMLDRAERIPVTPHTSIPVVQTEDLIGLKVQAACNDPNRALSDWSDIQLLVQFSAKSSRPLDWDLLSDYLELFDQSEKLASIKEWYGSAYGQ